jgi:hypothetical protein
MQDHVHRRFLAHVAQGAHRIPISEAVDEKASHGARFFYSGLHPRI